MGRHASHVTLECALKTQPNMALISEEIAEKKLKLPDIVSELADLIIKRSEQGKNYGVILLPEGIVEFIPEMKTLIEEHEKDVHGNVQVSKIEIEKLFIELVGKELEKRSFKGKFSAQGYFLGYEGRSALPSNFDATYCYSLGMTAALLVLNKATGYIACISNLKDAVEEWKMGGKNLISMMHLEKRLGKEKPVIAKSIVDLKSSSFITFTQMRESWKWDDNYLSPGPIQFYGPKEITDSKPITL
jgi:pyrophosphate--fructose-6-phosphate 1-phosphotransferase